MVTTIEGRKVFVNTVLSFRSLEFERRVEEIRALTALAVDEKLGQTLVFEVHFRPAFGWRSSNPFR